MSMSRGQMRQFQKMQERLMKAQAEIVAKTVEATAGGGAVKVTVSGDMKVKSLKISPEVVDAEDVEMLEDLVIAAVNEALEEMQKYQTEQMAGLTGGLGFPTR
jgi:DNA-binding YbaB/EbfC family protein